MIRYWPYAAAILLLGGLFAYHRVAIHSADKAGYARAVDEMATQIAIANAKTDTLDIATRLKSNEAAISWESTRNGLQTQITGLLARSAEPIRLCKPVASPRPVPGAVADTASPDDATGGREPALRVGPDIRRPLVVHGGQCEADRLQLIKLQRLLDARAR